MNAAMNGAGHEDAVTSAYRIHGWGYLMGLSVKQVIGELIGVEAGCSMGKGGSMHMYGPNFYGQWTQLCRLVCFECDAAAYLTQAISVLSRRVSFGTSTLS